MNDMTDGLFSQYLRKDEPQGIEGVRRRLEEARRKAAPVKTTVDPNIAIDYHRAQLAKEKAKGPTVVQQAAPRAGTEVSQPSLSPSDQNILRAANAVSGGAAGGGKPPVKPPAAKPAAPEPEDDGTGGKLDGLLKDIRSTKTPPAPGKDAAAAKTAKTAVDSLKTPPQNKVAQKLDTNGDGNIDRDDVKQIIGNLTSQVGTLKKPNKNLQGVLSRLEDPVAGPRIRKFLAAMIDEDKRSRSEHEKLSTFSDKDGALRFLTEGMGLSYDKQGRLTLGAPNRERRALGGAGMPGEGRGEPRGFGYREIQSLLDPTRAQMLRDAQNDETGAGARLIHKAALKNDIPWDLATELYEMIDPGLQGKLNGWGKPVAEQGTFTPLGPVEYLKDGDGNFTGETNIDALARTDPEAYQTHFSQDNEGNRGRGIFNLMKHLSQGGVGEFSGLPNFFDFDTQTPDHIMGRSSGSMPNNRAKDDPLNLAFDRRGLNQVKVSSSLNGERDTLESLLNAATKVNGGLGKVEYDGEDVQNIFESPNFLKFLAYRLGQKDFDPATIAKRGGKGVLDKLPESLEELLELGDDGIKQLVGKNESKNPLGLNMRNVAMRAPRPGDTPLLPNSWSGAPGGGLEYTPLTGFRRALLANALFDPEMQRQMTEHEEGLRSRRRPLSDEKMQAEMDKKRRDLIAHNLFGPQKAIGTLFGLGRLNNEDFISKLSEFGGGRLGFLQESNPEMYEKLMGGLKETLDDYREKLDGKLPDGPFNVPDESLMGSLDSSYMRAIMGSNYGRSMMSPEIIKAFDAIEKHSKIKDNLYDETDFTLNPDTDLL